MVWNRLRYVKNPDTGKRVSRLNPSSEWITTEVPHLRIVPDELWSFAKERQTKARRAIASTGKLAAANRPRYLFSGLTKCGVCGAGFILGSANRLSCFGARGQGTCSNRLTIRRNEVEARVLTALQEKLYQAGASVVGSRLTWVDRGGKSLGVVADRANYGDIELSPDGTQASVSVQSGERPTRDIWLVDLTRGLRTRFTFDPAMEQSTIWSPDGNRLVFNSTRAGRSDLYQKSFTGTATEEPLLADVANKIPRSWSPDGKYIVYSAGLGTGADLWILPVSSAEKPFPFIQTPFGEGPARFSPDGRWIAYASVESASPQVYVVPFPGPGGKRQVSAAGGDHPRWRRDGKELFYLDGQRLMAAAVNGEGTTFQIGAVQPLFTVRTTGAPRSNFDVAADGQRFLVNMVDQQTTAEPITVVVNWPAGVSK